MAVYIGLNVEVFDFGGGYGAELAPKVNQPDGECTSSKISPATGDLVVAEPHSRTAPA